MTDGEAHTSPETNSEQTAQPQANEVLSMDERQEQLKQSRWNVFLWLGIAVLMFIFALFPMPFSADYDGLTSSAEKDIGLVWGPSLPGDDIMDAPIHLIVSVENPPSTFDVNLEAYMIKMNNCQQNLATFTNEARQGDNHNYQHQIHDEKPVKGGEYTFKFSVDPGQYCAVIQYVDADGKVVSANSDSFSVKGRVWSSQIIGGVLGIICLSLSIFAFIGAQKNGLAIRELLESEGLSTEQKVLDSAISARLAAGPSGPPGAPGPTGAPPAAGPTGPPSSGPSGPPQAELEIVQTEETSPLSPQSEGGGVYEPAENGYFFKKMPDGNYEQTVYVQNDDGTYTPYEG